MRPQPTIMLRAAPQQAASRGGGDAADAWRLGWANPQCGRLYLYSPMSLSRRYFFFGSFLLGNRALPAFAAKQPAGEQPNILLILVDGLPSWILGCYGGTEVQTPNIDRLCQTGTRFLNHFVCAPVAGASRAVLLTGRTSMQLHDAGSVPAGEIPLDKILPGQGYVTQTADGSVIADAVLEKSSAAGKPFLLTVSYKFQAPYEGVAQKYLDVYAQARLDTFDREPPAKNAQRDKQMLTGILANQRRAAAAATALDAEIAAPDA